MIVYSEMYHYENNCYPEYEFLACLQYELFPLGYRSSSNHWKFDEVLAVEISDVTRSQLLFLYIFKSITNNCAEKHAHVAVSSYGVMHKDT